MTVIMNEKKFDRILTILAGFLCLLALVFTIIAIRTSSWTINEYSTDGEVQWHGLFYRCNRMGCTFEYNHYFPTIFLLTMSAIFFLLATVCIFLMGGLSFPRRHFYLSPSLAFCAVLLLYVALIIYARESIINGISARLVIAAIVLGFTSCAIATFVSGRYSIFYQQNPTDFYYTKTEKTESVKRVDEQQTMQAVEN